ncbi:DoxX family protein [uncultured Lentibacter sp.]|jgi:putative oxidoreductase|uniref:DoxX family protein n=1 Tax=uncultured Lentibacter sp. TaxID=1659309 RepID=UPI00261B49B5|nr:DoxX family protein [uncultured Lentibacter sp.]
MTQHSNTALLIARIFMGLLFLMAGLGKLGNVEGFAGYLASGGLPAFLTWPAILFEIVAGLLLVAGFFTRYTALALAAFCLASGLLYHFDPSDQNQMTNLLKNIALAGGFIALAIAGAGKFSLDARKA